MLISVDFDGTLTRSDVQKFVLEAVANGNKVIIVTQRYNEAISNKMFGEKVTGWNKEVVDMGRRLGVSKIYFTNHASKYLYLQELDSDIHLDDSNQEVNNINQNLKNTFAINVTRPDWQQGANYLVKESNYNYK